MNLGADGWVVGVEHRHSPNYDQRPTGCVVSMIVVHAISLPPGRFGDTFVDDFFCNCLDVGADPYFSSIAELKVSAHFLVRRSGRITQFVSCHNRAWHAGVSNWKGRERCNDFSIGIELEGCDDLPFEASQYEALRSLVSLMQQAFPIDVVVGHEDIAPERKTDPGPFFEWKHLSGLHVCLRGS